MKYICITLFHSMPKKGYKRVKKGTNKEHNYNTGTNSCRALEKSQVLKTVSEQCPGKHIWQF